MDITYQKNSMISRNQLFFDEIGLNKVDFSDYRLELANRKNVGSEFGPPS